MPHHLIPVLLLAAMAVLPATARSQESLLFREEFETLDAWKPFTFKNIARHTVYTAVREGDTTIMKAASDSSASGLIWTRQFDVYKYPKVRWRWKIDSVYEHGNARMKEGDDYPLRIYIMFAYDPNEIGFLDRMKYRLAKQLYGEYPPLGTVNYIWANRDYDERVITNAWTDRAKMVLLREGDALAGEWVEEAIDILADYREAFGGNAPHMASIGIMNDSDNTGGQAVSYLDYIEVYR